MTTLIAKRRSWPIPEDDQKNSGSDFARLVLQRIADLREDRGF